MKYLLIGSLCLSFLVGCQSYPKKAAKTSMWERYAPVNKFVPLELTPYEIPPEVEYLDTNKEVPKTVVMVKAESK